MKAKMKPAMLALTLTLGICLLFPSVARAQGMPCTGQPDEPITYGDIITCSIAAPGDSGTFVFNGTTGERIEVVISSSGNYPCVELVGVGAACSPVNRNWVDAVLTQTRQYTIRTYQYNPNGTLDYTLALQRVVPPSPTATQITYGNNLPGQINPYGDLVPYFFTASVGDVIDVAVVSTGNYPCIAMYAPDTTTGWGSCSPVNRNEIRTPPLTLAGSYTILVYEYHPTGTLSFNLDLECLGVPCVVTPIPDVSGYIKLRGAPLPHAGVSLTQPGSPSPQLAITDSNGYYQFLHIISGQTFNVLIHGPASLDFGTPLPAEPASADTVGEDPLK